MHYNIALLKSKIHNKKKTYVYFDYFENNPKCQSYPRGGVTLTLVSKLPLTLVSKLPHEGVKITPEGCPNYHISHSIPTLYIGCTLTEFKNHLFTKYATNSSWENLKYVLSIFSRTK